MITLNVRMDQISRASLRDLTNPSKMAFAERQAINRTAANVQKAGHALVAKKMGIPKNKLAKRGRRVEWRGSSKHGAWIVLKRATMSRPIAVLRGTGRPFNVARFNAQPIFEGQSSSLEGKRRRKRGKRRVIGVVHNAYNRRQAASNVWRARSLGSPAPYLVRSGDSFRGVYGPGVTWQLEQPEIYRVLERFTERRFLRHYSQALDYVFSRASHV